MRYINIFKIIIRCLTVLICLIWGISIFEALSHENIFNLQFTNIAAATFFVLANVSFSWSRSLNPDRFEITARRLNRIAFACIFTSLLLIFTSFSNYILQTQTIFSEFIPVTFLLKAAKWMTLVPALILIICILYEIIRESWHLIEFEYLVINENNRYTDFGIKIPKRISGFELNQRLLECFRANSYEETKINDKTIQFKRGLVDVYVDTGVWPYKLTCHVSYKNDLVTVTEKINTRNIHYLNDLIRICKNKHNSSQEELPELQYLENL